ncbi:hypothetical protein Droror1_Dr00004198 [Drosera rotundifolia]
MEISTQCFSYAMLNYRGINSGSKFIYHSTPALFPSRNTLFKDFIRQPISVKYRATNQGKFGVVFASSLPQSQPLVEDGVDQGWLLEPVGDGDWRHIGYRVQMPGSYEIVSDEVTIGRVPDKADLVIPVATVSGLHAKIQRKGGSLFITDLGSTNGTFIDEKRLKPGLKANVQPGSFIAFGDIHLAIFRVSKLQRSTEALQEPGEQKEIAVPEGVSEAAATVS